MVKGAFQLRSISLGDTPTIVRLVGARGRPRGGGGDSGEGKRGTCSPHVYKYRDIGDICESVY